MSKLFDVEIMVDGQTVKPQDQYVPLEHKSEYSIRLINRHATRCDADVSIDGKSVGVWRVEAGNSIVIDRPSRVNRRFTFVKDTSQEAKQAGVTPAVDTNGLIRAVFTPERHSQDEYLEPMSIDIPKYRSADWTAGGTILGASSDQTFGETQKITDIDHDRITTVHLRLVVEPEYIALHDPVPTPVKST